MSTYTVADAGTTDCNGSYTPDGSYGGKSQWSYSGSSDKYYLRWDDGYPPPGGAGWYIYADNGGLILYYTLSSAETPPETGWTTEEGTPPAPSVTLAGGTLAGDSTITQTWYRTGFVTRVVFDIVADSGDGSVTPATLDYRVDGFLVRGSTKPGTPAPTDNYDIRLVDGFGFDRAEGCLTNRDESESEDANIVIAGTTNHPSICQSDMLTLTVAGNLVPSAVIKVTLWFVL
jgi:hypothetical protein